MAVGQMAADRRGEMKLLRIPIRVSFKKIKMTYSYDIKSWNDDAWRRIEVGR